MKASTKLFYCLIAGLAVIVSAGLTRLTDDGLGVCWTHNVLRNWEEFGFFHLHGQLVCNVGGVGIETQPDLYTGHRAFSLYPAFFCFHYLGGSTGVSIYYALLAAIVLWSIWQLLGRTQAAFWLAMMAVVAPGYIRWQTTLDPNLAAALYGFPYCAAVVALLQKPAWRWPHLAGLAALMLVYSAINWSTAFIHAMLCAFMLVQPGISKRRFFIYTGLGILIAGAVVAISLATRISSAKSAGLVPMLMEYGWGNVGYGLSLSTHTALLRLVFVNTIGWLAVLGFLAWRSGWQGISVRMLTSFFPLLTAGMSVLALRNYFSHHPWMSCHFMLLGLMLSAVVLKTRQPLRPALAFTPGLVWFVVALVYGFGVLSFYQVSKQQELALIRFVQVNTPRSATLLVAQDKDPELASLINRYEFDRHYTVIPSLATAESWGTNTFVLTMTPPPGRLVTHLDNRITQDSWRRRLLAWYARVIAHRNPGDKVEVGNDYYLYQP